MDYRFLDEWQKKGKKYQTKYFENLGKLYGMAQTRINSMPVELFKDGNRIDRVKK